MIIFYGKKYDLFFSNQLAPLIALNYADKSFFENFEKLCEKRYRILSIIRKGWQQKYGLIDDVEKLRVQFNKKIDAEEWIGDIIEKYDKQKLILKKLLKSISTKDYKLLDNQELITDIKKVREQSSLLDAMSNMLHLFSSLVGHNFLKNLQRYTDSEDIINKNFILYTQPIKESRFAKINIKKLDNQIKLSRKDSNFSNILRTGTFIKDDVSELLELRKKLTEGLFTEVATRIQCKNKDLDYLQIPEIENCLLNNKNLNRLVQKRRQLTILFYPEYDLQIFEGKAAEKFIEKGKLEELVEKIKIDTLKGQTASLGKAVGQGGSSHE